MNQILCDHIQTIGDQIKAAEEKFNRPKESVTLLAVSKRHPISAIQQSLECEQIALGENYAQEMHEKAQQLEQSYAEWHFIGPIQSNKTRLIAEHASWIHSIDRLKIARRINEHSLSEHSSHNHKPINICLQVNINNENSKSGVLIGQLPELAEQVSQLSGIKLRGLMAIPEATNDFDLQRKNFAKVRKAMEGLNQQGYNLDTLSMGMSGDMEAAIAEGATIVRIGTAIFGKRPN